MTTDVYVKVKSNADDFGFTNDSDFLEIYFEDRECEISLKISEDMFLKMVRKYIDNGNSISEKVALSILNEDKDKDDPLKNNPY